MKSWSRSVAVAVLALGTVLVAAPGAWADEKAKQLLERNGCLMCHSLLGKGGKMGPPLQSIPAWADAARIAAYIKDPKAVNEKSIMRPSRLTDAEIQTITDYIMTFKDTAQAPKGWKGD